MQEPHSRDQQSKWCLSSSGLVLERKCRYFQSLYRHGFRPIPAAVGYLCLLSASSEVSTILEIAAAIPQAPMADAANGKSPHSLRQFNSTGSLNRKRNWPQFLPSIASEDAVHAWRPIIVFQEGAKFSIISPRSPNFVSW
jgi:hypothetical protein